MRHDAPLSSVPKMSSPTLHTPTLRRLLHKTTTRLSPTSSPSTPRAIPTFLVPAFTHHHHISPSKKARNASTLAAPQAQGETQVRPRQSRIGRTPINVPPEVSLRFVDLPKGNARSRHPDTASVVLEVTGPLGMSCLSTFFFCSLEGGWNYIAYWLSSKGGREKDEEDGEEARCVVYVLACSICPWLTLWWCSAQDN